MRSFIMGFKSVNIVCGLMDMETYNTKVKLWTAKLPLGERR